MLSRALRCYLPVLAAVLSTACSPDLPGIAVSGVDPAWGYNGDETDVTISGDAFYPRVQAGSGAHSEVDRQYEAWLVDDADDGERLYALERVALVSYQALEASVPANLGAGVYGLEVLSPGGERARMDEAFTVTSTRADSLAVDADSLSYTVGDVARLEISLLDPSAQVVEANLEEGPFMIEVTASRVSGEETPDLDSIVSFEATLDDQQGLASLDGVVGVRGYLGLDGTGQVTLSASAAEELLISIEPADADSVVEGSLTVLQFEPGAASSVEIELPESDFTTTAGEPFDATVRLVDDEGNPTQGAVANVVLLEGCGQWWASERIVDEATIEVTPTAASGTATTCEENTLVAQLELGSEFVETTSEGFQVSAGEVAQLGVYASPSNVTVGVTEVTVVAIGQDAYGNVATGLSGDLVLDDSVGGLSSDGSAGTQSCAPFTDGSAVCSAFLWKTGTEVQITATVDDTIAGTSAALTVVPDIAYAMVASTSASEITAGDDAPITIQVVDRFDNPLELDPTGVDVPVVTDDGDEVTCVWVGTTSADHSEHYNCNPTRAEAGKTLDIALDVRDLSTSVGPIDVVNAEVGQIAIDFDGVDTAVAGVAVTTSFAAFDEYGNPYIEQSDSTVTLSDLSGSLAPTSLSLDDSGTSIVDLTYTVAMSDNQLTASHSGAELGTSSRFDIEPADVGQLEVSVGASFAWVDEDTAVYVTAVDGYGNTVTDYSGSVTVSSDDGLADAVQVNVSSGIGGNVIVYDASGLQDTLIAREGDLSGTSDPIDALDADCADPPTATISVASASPAVLCRSSSGTTPSTSVSASGSSSGGSSLVAYHFDVGDGDWERTSSRSTTATWSEDGAYLASVVVADIDGCGDQDFMTIYVGATAGPTADQPTGPVEIEVDDDTLTVSSSGSSSSVSTTVYASATDCSGDPAASGTLYLRADLGALSSSGSSTLVSTGEGLALTLDSSGEGELTWSMASTVYDGEATLHAGVPSSAAYGSVQVTATGESAPPTVHWITPSGTTDESFDSVVVTFSEPMDTDFATPERMALTAPDGGDLPIDDDWLSFDDDEDTLTITLDTTYDAGEGEWAFALTSGLRDQGGSQLDGEYRDAASAFAMTFGDVENAEDDVTDCSVSTSAFRPDGDDGSDEDADQVDISVSADVIPDLWEMVITDADGAEVLVYRTGGGTSASTTLEWDGRGTDGHVLPNGDYALQISALDESWNAGDVCTVDVTIDNRYPSSGVTE